MKRCAKCGIITPDDSLMTCQNCGQQFPEPVSQPQPAASGFQQPAQPAYQPQSEQPVQPTYQQPVYQQPVYQQPVQPAYQPQPEQPAYQPQPVQNAYQQTSSNPAYPSYNAQPDFAVNQPPMKWYKALIYAILFISMILNAFSAYQLYTGEIYVDSAIQSGEKFSESDKEEFVDFIYAFYGSELKTCDMFYVICLVISVIFALITRQALAKFKKNAPKLITGLYAYNLIIAVIYTIWQYSIMSAKVPDASLASGVASSLAMSLAMVIANYKYFKNREHLFCN